MAGSPPPAPRSWPCELSWGAPGGACLHVAGPEREVVAQELHDEGAVLVGLLPQGVQLSNRLVKRLQASGQRQA